MEDKDILMKISGNYLTSKMNGYIGYLALTKDNLVFFKQSIFLRVMFGLLANLSKGKPVLLIPLNEIKSITKVKFRLNSNTISVVTKDDKEYKFPLMSNADEMLFAVKGLLK